MFTLGNEPGLGGVREIAKFGAERREISPLTKSINLSSCRGIISIPHLADIVKSGMQFFDDRDGCNGIKRHGQGVLGGALPGKDNITINEQLSRSSVGVDQDSSKRRTETADVVKG